MTSKKTWLMLLAGVVCALSLQANAAFKCDVYVGNSDGVSLTFGVGDALKPFPPFSAMFGVKDIFLAHPANYTDAADVAGDMARLGTALTADGPWLIVANSNATLTFKMTDAAKVYVAYVDPKSDANVTTEVENNGTLSVKAGVSYTVALSQTVPPELSEDPMSQNVAIQKNEDKDFVANKVFGGLTPGAEYTLYFATDGTVSQGTHDGAAGWEIALEGASGEDWGDDSVSFTADSASVTMSMKATSGSAKPLTATLVDDDDKKIAAINAILQKFGTLDFDGDGEIDINDVMYLFNFANAGGEIDDPSELAVGTVVTDEGLLATALDTLSGNNDSLDYDADGEIDINDVMYLFNFANAGGDIEEAAELAVGTIVSDEGLLSTALENLKDQSE